jgi:hypothetical protein
VHPPDRPLAEEFQHAWSEAVRAAGSHFRQIPAAIGEQQLIDPASGVAQLGWPTDVESTEALRGFDLLLLTATEPTPGADECPPVPLAGHRDSALYGAQITVRRRNSWLMRSSAFVVRSAFHCDRGKRRNEDVSESARAGRGRAAALRLAASGQIKLRVLDGYRDLKEVKKAA